MALKPNPSLFDNGVSEGMNITFFYAKSNCLPPIHRAEQ
jgi:hypothetical protein